MRRAALLLLTVALLSGCGITAHERKVETTFADFRPYSTKGFYFLTGEYNGPFIPLGILYVEVTPSLSASTGYEAVPGSVLIETAYKEARKLGANGMTEFKVTAEHSSASLAITKYIVSGTLILITEPENGNAD